MRREAFENLPYVSKEEALNLKKYLLKFVDERDNFIQVLKSTETYFSIADNKLDYLFNIKDVNFDKSTKKTIYTIDYKPHNQYNNNYTSYVIELEPLKQQLQKWYTLILNIEKVTYEFFNPFDYYYENEFKNYFTNEDEDSAYNPFDLKQQEVIYYFINYIEYKVLKSEEIPDEQKDELIKETKLLKENLPKTSKSKLTKGLSKLAENIKKTSNKLFHDVFDITKKEGIKFLLKKGIEQIPAEIKTTEFWINLFN
jgi:hypothetical protein